ncbi:MAG: aminotransferase class I/II-fold pyridoxal phosphate-dependent enzyme [Christensenellaceae bacterium]
MKTPICDFLQKYADSRPIRAHMPGHKGVGDCKKWDITEIDGADSLFDASGIIDESEKNASLIFGSNYTLYSTEGSSLCIRTMVFAVCQYAKRMQKKPLILAGRNAHYSFVSAVALTDADVEWFYGDGNLLSCDVSAEALEDKLKSMAEKPTAVYVTSPDYLGNILPIKRIKEVCAKYGSLLIVDNAHGAYLNFLADNLHPITLGADMCCDSAHKTLFVLTGGAYLHVAKSFKAFEKTELKNMMKTFASTSPSYLILRSLDAFNAVSGELKELFSECEKRIKTLKKRLIDRLFTLIGNEPFKITVKCKPLGYYGYEIAKILKEDNIYVEYCDADFVVLMLSPLNCLSDFSAIENALLRIAERKPIPETELKLSPPEKAMSIRQATFEKQELVPVGLSSGRIMANPCVSCPPAVAVLVSGEIIGRNQIEIMKYYNVSECFVVSK